jgi:serine/threonine-protein kinase
MPFSDRQTTDQPSMTRRLGRYELYDELGRGATAIVYRAFDPRIKRLIAIKVLRDEYAKNSDYRRRFLAEARFAGTLTHPNIMTVFDVGEASGQPFMAMELLDGPTLEQVARARPLTPEQTLRIAVHLADALRYAHAAGVVHRDIKPDNIICTDNHGNVKLMDFGIAQLQHPNMAAESTGVVAGTPKFMSPEQMSGNPLDGRSDLYSLGVVLYRLVSNTAPFQADCIGDLFEQITEGPTPDIKPLSPATPPALLDVIRVLMQRDPAHRFQTGQELLEELQRIEFDFLETQRSWAGRAIVPLRIRWSVLVGVLVAATMLVGVFLVYQRQNEAMENLALDYGASVTRIIATETSEDLLLGDAIAIQSTVNSMERNREMVYLTVADHRDQILASTQANRIGELIGDPQQTSSLQQIGDFTVWEESLGRDTTVFQFRAPIRYQQQRVGTLELGLSRSTLTSASQTTLHALLVLLLVTLLAVFSAVYALTRRLTAPMEQLRRAMGKLNAGDFAYRIRINRADEFARLFNAFNLMAESLQSRLGSSVQTAKAPGNDDKTEEYAPMDETLVDEVIDHPRPEQAKRDTETGNPNDEH